MTNSTSIPGSKVGRARRSLSQLWQVPTFLIGLLAFIGVAASAPWRLTPQEREFAELFIMLRHGLEHDEAGDVLVGHAENVKLRMHRFPTYAFDANFLVGSAYYRMAQQKPAAYAKAVWPLAAEHLEEALACGVAEKDRVFLQYRLGLSLYQQNKDVPRALELMMLGVEKGAEQPLQGYQLLVQAYLKQTPPNVDSAMSAIRRILDLTPEREIEAIAAARLQHADLLMRKEQRADAVKELERIGSKASRAVRLKARLLQARCCEEDGLWSKAIPIWQELLADSAQVEGDRARILYALGRCYQQMEPAKNADCVRVWSEALKLGGPDGQAAGLRLGDLRLMLGGDETERALADWKVALEKVETPEDFRNPYIKMELVREWFEQAILKFQEAQDPQKTQAVAELFRKIAPKGLAEKQVAEAAEAVAKQFANRHRAMMDNVTAADVKAQYHRAGDAWVQAVLARTESERPESLWRSAQCYILAKEIMLAQQILSQYVKLEQDEARLAEGWHTLGDLYRAEGKKDHAREAYLKCIEYPNTPFAYRSRYFLALEEIDKKNYEQARKILEQNLVGVGGAVEIDRAWQEKSVFRMATLLMDMKNYHEAHLHMKEFVQHFPENPNVPQARLQLGECYRELAKKERLKEDEIRGLIKPNMPDDARRNLEESISHQRTTRMKKLNEAVKAYQQLADELENESRKKQLSDHEQTLRRRAGLGIGECHLDEEEYATALSIFQKLQGKNRRTLEGFYASPFICYVLDKMQLQQISKQEVEKVRESAKDSVRLLLEDLRALPKEHEVFNAKNVPARDEWLRWAEDTQRKLMAPPKIDSGLPAFR
jgi:tetratricopeptide (TPR) repeat protein